ncbi:MAG: peptide MFS transporter, partial [Acidobacteria bacterium]|nr:peptide MFS transporter [Acidobacteriota bacterium]
QVMEKHPKGLYVLFMTEMWERFGFYTLNAMLVLYMKNNVQGFGWSAAHAASINAYYLFFVYLTPLIGGFIADRLLGFRRSVTIGAVFFMLGYGLLAVPNNIPVFFLALVFIVTGNGFFKPNISSMVGNLYKEGSHLKDKAYLIFYMGINIGALLAPIVAEFVRKYWGFNPGFACASFGMVICLVVFWSGRKHIEHADPKFSRTAPVVNGEAGSLSEDFPPNEAKKSAVEEVPEWKRVMALIVVFIVVIVFWMVFHQNSSTLTLWADENTSWNVTGILSNAINPLWIIVLAPILAWFWGVLDKRGLEPSTPTKIAIGMFLTAASFFFLYAAARAGGFTKPAAKVAAISESVPYLALSPETREALGIDWKGKEIELTFNDPSGQTKTTMTELWLAEPMQGESIEQGDLVRLERVEGSRIVVAEAHKVSPWWLIMGYFILSLGELCLSPMGLSLVSKVAPPRMRGVMMGGWFVATAIGNKLTAIGVYWEIWSHAKFFLVLAMMALGMAVLLLFLLRPLKKAMPGV